MSLIEEEKKLLLTLLKMLNKNYSKELKEKIYVAAEETRSAIRHLSSQRT